MSAYHRNKASCEQALAILRKAQNDIHLFTLLTLVASCGVSQLFLRAFQSPLLFLVSSLALLVIGLNLIFEKIRKSATKDQIVVDSIEKGLSLEIACQYGQYFQEVRRAYLKHKGFLWRLYPYVGLYVLTAFWLRHCLICIGGSTSSWLPAMIIMAAGLSIAGYKLLNQLSQPYRQIREFQKKLNAA